MSANANAAQPAAKGSTNATPLANSYYNSFPYDPNAAAAYYQNYQRYSNQAAGYNYPPTFFTGASNQSGTLGIGGTATPVKANTGVAESATVGSTVNARNQIPYSRRMPNDNVTGSSVPRGSINFRAPPPPPPPGNGVDPIKQNIHKTLHAIKEKPKTYGKNIYDTNQGYNDQAKQGYGGQGYNKQGFDQGYGNKGFYEQGYNNQNSEGFNKANFGNRGRGGFSNRGLNRDDGFNNQGYSRGGSSFNNNQGYNERESNFGGNQQFNRPVLFSRRNDDYNRADYNDGFNDNNYDSPNKRGGFNSARGGFNNRGGSYTRGGSNTRGGFNNRGGFGNRGGFSGNREYDDPSYEGDNSGNKRFGNQRFKRNFDGKPKFPKKKKPAYDPPVEQTVPDLLDATLPKDLKLLFQPLFCKLCSLQLTSNQTAKTHYQSKKHEKKIRIWLTNYSEKTGEPLHPRATPAPPAKKEEDAEKNPAWFHCDVCDLDLTGKVHAESHYMGRNHQKVMMGHKDPTGQGFYRDGKWVRIKGQKSKSYDFEKGEDNFGVDFKSKEEKAKIEGGETVGPPKKKKKVDDGESKEFHCDVCDITTTCQDQLDTHFRGQKHAKKLKLLGLGSYVEQRKKIDEATGSLNAITKAPAKSVTPVPSVQASPTTPTSDNDIVLSVYRTPSGDYYCGTCNVTTNSEVQFLQHMKSKAHARKAAQKK